MEYPGRPRVRGLQKGDPWSEGNRQFSVRMEPDLWEWVHSRGGVQYLRDMAQSEMDAFMLANPVPKNLGRREWIRSGKYNKEQMDKKRKDANERKFKKRIRKKAEENENGT